ncbi:fructose bisphosphate aldolase [Acetobacter sp.]|jgi:fructose-bisphosphate aldolase class I|uniref:fructose bisphosphate aldolase n=1 Tax=Acetobacter sp. TaxID=440 RepID=UPI0025C4D636|nr:fructose bisphosphate aldolase [Acetobacter sp.]MCH4090967.1 fructose bisphosphate aldolase [Acetobacter sp.]MCI1300808.1 fructose bisphosphate aldolase [Acetobacter sp.]MCI1317087.1 fructose bisphosphate aldolase [Acetobacter sp.]
MSNDRMKSQISEKGGFIAALDQSGGSTPGALKAYGIPETAYSSEEDMFRLIHDMRVRIITAPSFSGEKVIGAILFERTMDGLANGKPVPAYLWEERGVVPFLKIDKGLEDEANGVRLMKPNPGLDALLERAAKLGVYGTKERSVINLPNQEGIAAVVKQQFEVAHQVASHGLVAIIEPEVLVNSPDKKGAEAILHDELLKALNAMPGDYRVMLKVTIPEVADLYDDLSKHPRVERVVALSGGYSLDESCERLKKNHGMIASFSRALLGGLQDGMSDAEFDAALGGTISKIYDASVNKV